MRIVFVAAGLAALASCSSMAKWPIISSFMGPPPLHVAMNLVTATGTGDAVGEVLLRDARGGVTVELDLHGLPPGPHGFHIHANNSCAASTGQDGTVTPAGAAGAHWDPSQTGHHMGPNGQGHMGDMPLFTVNASGEAKDVRLTLPRIHDVAQLRGHALVIHANGDNYTDTPPNGGGGARLACGLVQ